MKKKKLDLSGAFAIVLALLIVAVFVPINMIFSYTDKVYDMTPSKKYTLDPMTVELLDGCRDKEVEIYFLSSLYDLQSVPRTLPLYHTLTKLDEYDNITLTCFDPNEDAELAQSLNPTGLLDVSLADIFVKSGDVIKQIPFKRCFIQDTEGIIEYRGENLIAGAVKICTGGSLPTVSFLKGCSEKSVDVDYSFYRDTIRSDNYYVNEIDLTELDKVPDETCIVCIAAPVRDITMSERQKLSDYIDNGGKIAMFLPPCETEGRFENIEYLLAKFEIGMDYNIVTEKNVQLQLTNNDSAQDEHYFKVSYPAKSDDYTVDLTSTINELCINGYYVPGIANTRSFYALTGQSAMIEKDSIIENLPETMDQNSYTTVSTPMGGDAETAKTASQLSQVPLIFGYYSYNKQTGSKLIVIGSDEAIDNMSVPTEINPAAYPPLFGTRRLIQFTNTWLYDSDVDMGISSKYNSYDTMEFEDGKDASRTIKLFFVIPAAFAVAGLGVWLKRRYA